VRAQVPPYFDLLIEGFRAGRAGRHVHLGYWDVAPPSARPCAAAEFEAAQARLCDILIALAQIGDGQSVLDVGCGFGGTLAAIDARRRHMGLVGLNIDRRQLDICRTLTAQRANRLSLVLADACAMPFCPQSFDRIVCLEAMFHFRARPIFLAQAARLLRPGGRLALTDILMKHPGERAPVDTAVLEHTLRRDYGPWPEPWTSCEQIVETARRRGLVLAQTIDATAQTLPSYRVTAPGDQDALPPQPSAGSLMRWLHREGYLSYMCLAFTKT
jgi:cyclopropane fatty-acyl-phospholipid synthase-like methyltransferase